MGQLLGDIPLAVYAFVFVVVMVYATAFLSPAASEPDEDSEAMDQAIR